MNGYFLYMRRQFYNFFSFLVDEKINLKVLTCSFTSLACDKLILDYFPCI